MASRRSEQSRRRRSGFSAPNGEHHNSLPARLTRFFLVKSAIHFHCTVRLTVAVLLAIFGSVVSAMVRAVWRCQGFWSEHCGNGDLC